MPGTNGQHYPWTVPYVSGVDGPRPPAPDPEPERREMPLRRFVAACAVIIIGSVAGVVLALVLLLACAAGAPTPARDPGTWVTPSPYGPPPEVTP
ncbi:MAG TPA: hypothetical protein VD864_11570 [Nocardioides sp.]|nr:hypothetical protein [Nocardioides sp.]